MASDFVCFANPDLYTTLYNLKNFGIRSEEVVAEVGANAKMNEFAAAMGLCNLRHIEEEIAKRKRVVERYNELLGQMEGIRILSVQEDVESNYAYYPILIDETVFGKTRDEIYLELREHDIYSRKYFYPLTSDQACFRNRYRNVSLQCARHISSHILTLPLYADLSLESVERIVDIICMGIGKPSGGIG